MFNDCCAGVEVCADEDCDGNGLDDEDFGGVCAGGSCEQISFSKESILPSLFISHSESVFAEELLDGKMAQSALQVFGFAFSNSSQILSPHLPTVSIGGFGSSGVGGEGFLKTKKAPMPTIANMIKPIIIFFIKSLYQKIFSYPQLVFAILF